MKRPTRYGPPNTKTQQVSRKTRPTSRLFPEAGGAAKTGCVGMLGLACVSMVPSEKFAAEEVASSIVQAAWRRGSAGRKGPSSDYKRRPGKRRLAGNSGCATGAFHATGRVCDLDRVVRRGTDPRRQRILF